ncbi:hypothetical protein HDU76_009259, partial [Blyttiomyces sp. JEL0837]
MGEVQEREIVEVTLVGVKSVDAFRKCLEFIYTGGYRRDWDDGAVAAIIAKERKGRKGGASGVEEDRSGGIVELQAAFRSLVKLLKLEKGVFGAGGGEAASRGMEGFSRSVLSLVRDPSLLKFADVALMLDAGEAMFCHQVILACRCPFFDAMFGDGARWMLNRDVIPPIENPVIVVQMTHLRRAVMEIVMGWVYGDLDAAELLSGVKAGSVGDLLANLMEVVAAANELLLDDLKGLVVCEVLNMIDLTNAGLILDYADVYEAEGLKKACLDFLCWNVETLVESGMLDSLSPELVADIERTLQVAQQAKAPFTRGDQGFFAMIKAQVAAAEDEAKRKRREEYHRLKALESANGSLGSLGGGDVTPGSHENGISMARFGSLGECSVLSVSFEEKVGVSPCERGSVLRGVGRPKGSGKGRGRISDEDEEPESPDDVGRQKDDDNIFDMDMDDGVVEVGKKKETDREKEKVSARAGGSAGKKAWVKVDLTTGKTASTSLNTASKESMAVSEVGLGTKSLPASSNIAAASGPSTGALAWGKAVIPELDAKSKTSLADIMKETELKKTNIVSKKTSLLTPNLKGGAGQSSSASALKPETAPHAKPVGNPTGVLQPVNREVTPVKQTPYGNVFIKPATPVFTEPSGVSIKISSAKKNQKERKMERKGNTMASPSMQGNVETGTSPSAKTTPAWGGWGKQP